MQEQMQIVNELVSTGCSCSCITLLLYSIYLLLYVKHILSDFMSYFDKKTILMRPFHGMFFLFIPTGHRAMAQDFGNGAETNGIT